MNTAAWLKQAQDSLSKVGIPTARLDCLVLLEDETGKDRGWLLAHPEFTLGEPQVKRLDKKVTRRAEHVPLAYIRGKAEFYGREFAVNAHTLVPRPETETMIELLKRVRNYDEDFCIVDIGTGSGAIAVTAKLELPEVTVIATDIDAKCLETARKNAQRLGADIDFVRGNLLEPLQGHLPHNACTILLCNLPYVPDNFQLNTAATHEPRHALFGGADGLDLYRELFGQIKGGPVQPAYVLTESLPPQHEVLAPIAEAAGYMLLKTDDFIQLFERAV